MLESYAPILVLLLVVAAFAVVSLVLSELLGPKRRSVEKGAAYESGMSSHKKSARIRLSIHFYLVAVLFILFDVEALLLFPWAATARALSEAGVGGIVLLEVAGFVAVLGVGLAYVWKKGGLEWDR
jgi:NADH-quinone oxidoreductase subunit A